MEITNNLINTSKAKLNDDSIRRFDINQIIQHWGMMTSFIILVLTGLPMKFYESAISKWWVSLWGGIEVIRSVHHFFAWVIVFVCIYHLVYLGYSTLILRKPFPRKIIPNPQDFVNLYREMLYFFGIKKGKPQYDRFNWREKFDYWAIFWGMPVMAISGFVLMFPAFVTTYLPGWIIPVSFVAHSDEAMLALLWIFMVHLFFNHLVPGIFPLNKSIFTGKVSKKRYQEDHPLEYNEMIESSGDKEAN
jgi:formate dehydrogenase subunit gamma